MKQAVKSNTAADILEFFFGKRPKAVKRIHGGLANHVFEATVDREHLIVRISDEAAKLPIFMKEQWAVGKARAKGVPTAEILEVGNDVHGLPYMICRKVEGRAGHACRDRMPVVQALGAMAARINSIPTSDYGNIFDWSRNKLSRSHTWPQYLDDELKVSERVRTLERAGVLPASQAKLLRGEVSVMRKWKIKPRLNHGDIRLKNVMLNEKQEIVALLDWENCTSNVTPYWELSIALHDLTMDEKEAFLEAYGLDVSTYLDMAPAIKAINILNYAAAVAIAVDQKDKAALARFRTRLSGSLDLYKL